MGILVWWGHCYLPAPLGILFFHLCLLDPLHKCYVPRSFDATVLPDHYFVWCGIPLWP